MGEPNYDEIYETKQPSTEVRRYEDRRSNEDITNNEIESEFNNNEELIYPFESNNSDVEQIRNDFNNFFEDNNTEMKNPINSESNEPLEYDFTVFTNKVGKSSSINSVDDVVDLLLSNRTLKLVGDSGLGKSKMITLASKNLVNRFGVDNILIIRKLKILVEDIDKILEDINNFFIQDLTVVLVVDEGDECSPEAISRLMGHIDDSDNGLKKIFVMIAFNVGNTLPKFESRSTTIIFNYPTFPNLVKYWKPQLKFLSLQETQRNDLIEFFTNSIKKKEFRDLTVSHRAIDRIINTLLTKSDNIFEDVLNQELYAELEHCYVENVNFQEILTLIKNIQTRNPLVLKYNENYLAHMALLLKAIKADQFDYFFFYCKKSYSKSNQDKVNYLRINTAHMMFIDRTHQLSKFNKITKSLLVLDCLASARLFSPNKIMDNNNG